MAIKGGNPLFTVEPTKTDDGFLGVVTLQSGKTIEQDFGREHPLYDAFAMFGWETKTRNTIGAITDPAKRTPEGAEERAEAITSAYDEGKWNVGRGEGDGVPGGGIVARALSEVITANAASNGGTPKTAAQVAEHIKAQFASIEDKKTKAAAIRGAWEVLEARPDVAPVVARLRAEAAAARVARLAEKAAKAPGAANLAGSLGL